MMQKLPCWRRGLLLVSLCLGATALIAQTANLVKNPTFLDADGDGDPDGWKPYPPGNGDTLLLASKPGGGLIFKDNDTNNGLGLEQWIPVKEGYRYTASATVSGNGAVNLNLIFAPNIPNRPGDLGKIKLGERSVRAEAGKTSEVIGVAPAGAKWMKLWLYYPKIGTTDVVVENVTLTSTDGPVASAASSVTPPATPSVSTPAAPVAPAGPAPVGNLLKNTAFADADGDGTPDGWNPYPPGNGSTLVLASKPGGGLVFKDDDKNNGLGIEQWVPVQEGLLYTASATADAAGSGGISLTLIFAPNIPNRPGDLGKIKLAEKSSHLAPGKTVRVVASAPAGAKWVKVWLYCPRIGVADLVVNELSLTASAPANSAAAPVADNAPKPLPAAPLPPGLAAVIDFETADFSQGTHNGKPEGGNVTIITAAEGPVRDRKYAAKMALSKDKVRAEVAGHRSEAAGIARYGWSMYMPKDFDAHTHFTIFSQWHSWGSGRESPRDGGPPTCLTIDKGEFHLKLLRQGDEGWTSKADYFRFGSIDDMRGRWTDWVMEVNWQGPGKGGWLKLYKDDKLILDHKGTTWYDDKERGPFFKMGLYKGNSKWKGEEATSILYFDAARMALGESSTYKMVDPKTYAPKPVRQ